MKRVILSVLGTIFGLVALLSFKSHDHVTVGAALPSAALGGSTSTTSAPPAAASCSAGEPPNAEPSSTAPSSAASTSKTYNGAAVQTRYGTVQVAVTISGSQITNVSFLQLTSYDGRSADINSQAGPLLLQETLTAQSSNIDTISGATYTSAGYVQSLQSALDQAGRK
jgi:uncharacterized protein with FMN-binding domain